MTFQCPLQNSKNNILGLLIEPYRPFFFFGALYNSLVMALWFTWLHGLEMGKLFLPFKISSLQAHIHWMLFGFPLFYIFGFLLTAFPKWTEGKQNPGKQNLKMAFLLFMTQSTFIFASLFSLLLARISLMAELLLQCYLFYLLLRLYLIYPHRKIFDQSFMVLLSLAFGIFAQISFQLSLWLNFEPYYSYSLFLAKYPFLLLLMISVSYRILPFFTSRVGIEQPPQRGKYTLLISLALILNIGACDLIMKSQVSELFSAVLKVSLAVLWLKELFQWNIKKSFSQLLLFSHYLSFLWAILFLFLKASFQIYSLHSPVFRTTALAVDHLLFAGGISTLLLGISTRVTRGHGGLGFALGKFDYLIFILLQLSVIIRCFFPLLENQIPLLKGLSFHASFIWWLAFSLWAFRYLPALIAKHKSNPL